MARMTQDEILAALRAQEEEEYPPFYVDVAAPPMRTAFTEPFTMDMRPPKTIFGDEMTLGWSPGGQTQSLPEIAPQDFERGAAETEALSKFRFAPTVINRSPAGPRAQPLPEIAPQDFERGAAETEALPPLGSARGGPQTQSLPPMSPQEFERGFSATEALPPLPPQLSPGTPAHLPTAVTGKSEGPPTYERPTIRDVVARASREYGVPEDVIFGVMKVESDFRPDVVGKTVKGQNARGLMQLMPATASDFANATGQSKYDIHDPEFNTRGGAYTLSRLLKKYDGDLDKVFAAYSHGPGNVDKHLARGQGIGNYGLDYRNKVKAAMKNSEANAKASMVAGEAGLSRVQTLQVKPPAAQFGAGGAAGTPGAADPDTGKPFTMEELKKQALTSPTPGMSTSTSWMDVPAGLTEELKTIHGQQIGDLRAQEQQRAEQSKVMQAALSKANKLRLRMQTEATDRMNSWADANLDPRLANVVKQTEELSKMKVDPQNYWNSQSTGQRVANILALALGAFTEGYTGGKVKNAALQMIDKAIERDIAAQRANIVAKQGQISASKDLYSMYMQQYKNKYEAEMATTSRLYDVSIEKLRELGEKQNSEKAALASGMMERALRQKQTEALMKIQKRHVQEGTSQPAHDPFSKMAAISKAAEPKDSAVNVRAAAIRRNKVQDIVAINDEAIKDLKGYLQELSSVNRWWAKAQELLVPKKYVQTRAHAIAARGNMMVGKVVRATYGGNASNPDREAMEATAPILGQTHEARIQATKNMLDTRMAALEALRDTAMSANETELVEQLNRVLTNFRVEYPKIMKIAAQQDKTPVPKRFWER